MTSFPLKLTALSSMVGTSPKQFSNLAVSDVMVMYSPAVVVVPERKVYVFVGVIVPLLKILIP